MAKYEIYGKVVGTKYLGTVEASSKEAAEAEGWKRAHVSVCHQCSREIDDPEIDKIIVECEETETA